MTQREAIIRAARSLLGGTYRWGGHDPATGLDCSGYVQWAYRQAGVEIPAGSYQQITLGKPVSREQLQPADIVSWGNGAHVGLYAGNGRVYNALNEERGIVDTALDGSYGMAYSGARSLLPADSPIVEQPAPVEESPNPKAPGRNKRHRRHLRREGKL